MGVAKSPYLIHDLGIYHNLDHLSQLTFPHRYLEVGEERNHSMPSIEWASAVNGRNSLLAGTTSQNQHTFQQNNHQTMTSRRCSSCIRCRRRECHCLALSRIS